MAKVPTSEPWPRLLCVRDTGMVASKEPPAASSKSHPIPTTLCPRDGESHSPCTLGTATRNESQDSWVALTQLSSVWGCSRDTHPTFVLSSLPKQASFLRQGSLHTLIGSQRGKVTSGLQSGALFPEEGWELELPVFMGDIHNGSQPQIC